MKHSPPPSPARTAAAPPDAANPDNMGGAAWMLLSVLSATVMTLAVREMASGLDSRMVVLLRSGGILLCALPLLAWPAFRRQIRFSNPRLHLIRGGIIAVSTQMGFYAIGHLPLTTSTILFFTAPIFATLLSIPLNGESVGPRRWGAMAMGFLGAVIILRPGAEGFQIAMVSALGSSVLFATALALSRGIAQADGPTSSFLSSIALTALVALPLAWPVFELPSGAWDWGLLALLLISSSGRGVGDLQSYRLGDSSVMGALSYSRLVLIGGAAWLLFGEVPDRYTLIGGAVIIGSTLYLAQREAAAARARPGPKAPPGP